MSVHVPLCVCVCVLFCLCSSKVYQHNSITFSPIFVCMYVYVYRLRCLFVSVRLHVSCVYLLLVRVLIANAHLSQRSTYAFPQSGIRCWKSCPTAFLSYTISVFVNGLFLKLYCSSVTSAVILSVTRLLVNVQHVQHHLQELKRIYFSLEGAFRGEVLQYCLSSPAKRFFFAKSCPLKCSVCVLPNRVTPCSGMFVQYVREFTCPCMWSKAVKAAG